MSIFISVSTMNKCLMIYSTSTEYSHINTSLHTWLHAYHMMTTLGGLSGILITVYMINMSLHSTAVILYHFHCILSLSCVLVVFLYCSSWIQYMYCHLMLSICLISSMTTRRIYTVLTPLHLNHHLLLVLLWSKLIVSSINHILWLHCSSLYWCRSSSAVSRSWH